MTLIDAFMQCGRTPLHFACEWGSIYGVKWLVAQNANVNVKDDVRFQIDFMIVAESLFRTGSRRIFVPVQVLLTH